MRFNLNLSRALVACAPLFLAGAPVLAQQVPAFEVTPFLTYRGSGSFQAVSGATQEAVSLKSGTGLALAFDWRATASSEYELLYSQRNSSTDGASPLNLKVEYLHIGGLADLGRPESRVMPYAVAGVGVTRLSPDALSGKTRWSANFGGGMRIALTRHVRLRFEARAYGTVINNQSCLFENSSGCVMRGSGSDVLLQYEGLGGVSVAF